MDMKMSKKDRRRAEETQENVMMNVKDMRKTGSNDRVMVAAYGSTFRRIQKQ
ncbi:hypothetical protein [Curtobacterium sp. C2H10]|uniref:hypothetical protein n=1 Tax=Curtobacterium sp. C2H10 TaxID=2736664 RepID=UPI0021BEA4CF|nr:hypothetical protein [Curtobacterium sp. C2H10]MCT9623447.1 hypothetical protein [Curtobacterium sp. C2H10]